MRKVSEALRFLGGLALAALLLGLVFLRVTSCAPTRPPPPRPPAARPAAPSRAPAVGPPSQAPPPPAVTALPGQAACAAGPAGAAQANAASLRTLAWSPFGRAESGWETYGPLIGHELGTDCDPVTPGFAAALAAWQGGHGLTADGVMTAAVFARLKAAVQARRPFVALAGHGICPPAPPASRLVSASASEGYGGKIVQLRPAALAAYRRLASAARAEWPGIAADPRYLTIFSGYRSPQADAARCAAEHNCGGVVRATCSAHRTGLAMDLYMGQAPGYPPDSTADPNRLSMSRSVAYRWMVANAARFGFVNYPFEPWHWEWTGEQP